MQRWGRWLAAWLLLWTATAELHRRSRFIGHHETGNTLAATHSPLHSCHLSEHHRFKDARRRKSFSALRSLLRYRGGAHQNDLGNTYKIQVELPDGRKRPVTLAGDAPLPELNRVIQRMLKTLPQAQQQGLQVQVVGSTSSLPLSSLKDSTEPQYSNIQSFFGYMVPDLQTQREFVVKVQALAAGPPSTATASGATPTKAKTVTLQDLQQREDSTAMMRIKHQKANKHRQVVVSSQVTPVLHAVYKTGGVAVLLGYVDTPAVTDAEKKNDPEGIDPFDSSSSARSRRARPSRRVVTLQDLQREEPPATGAPSETIHIQAAVTITRDILPAVSTGAEGSSINFIEELKRRLLPADIWQRLSVLIPTATPRRLQPVGLLIRNPSLTTRSPSSTEQGLSNSGWDPVACLSLLTVAEHLQNNATVLLTLTDPTAPPSSSSSGGTRRRRAVATLRVSNDFAVEAFMASRQAWQLQLNQSFVGPSAVVDAASSSSASSASSRRRASRQSPSANDETAETRQRRQSLRLRHPVYLNRQQGVVVDVDALLFAVPVAIALEQPSPSAAQTAMDFVHVFPSRDDRAASPRVAAEAERYAQKLIRKVVAGGRTEVDRDTWQRLYDVELWLYWLEQRWLSAAVLQGFINGLLSHADGAARGASARRRLPTSQVALALELLVQRWDASSMRSTATTGNHGDEDVEEDEE